MSDLFIGESDDDGHHTEEEDPLALSAHSDWEEDDSDTESGHKKPVSLATGRRLLDMITTAMKVFDEVAPAVAPNPYLSVAAPPQSGTYKVAGFARIRTRLAAEHRHIVECLGSDNLGNLRGNNVSALCLTVALMCTQADVSAAMFRVTVPDPAEEEEAAAQGGDVEESVVDDEAVAAVVAAPPTRPKRSVEVDLITDGGQKWVKVKASSATNFMREAAGVLPSQPYLPKGVLPEPGHAPFLDTLRLLLASAASQHYRLPFNRRPKIVVACAEEPPPVVRQVITDLSPDMEILVLKDIGCGPHAMFHERRRELQAPQGHLRLLPRASAFGFPVKRVNLDVTAMVAIVCDCCHGFAGHKFPKHHILQQQSTDEAAGQFAVDKYIAPTMNKFTVWGPPPADVPFGDDVELRDEAGESVTHPLSSLSATDKIRTLWPTNWIAAKRAVEEFTWILDTIAGPHELIRAAWLLRRLTVLDDSLPEYSSASVNSLKNTNKIQDRHRAVFGLGDAVEAITVTGNRTFVQAAQEQGVSLLVQFHPSRALTERKRRGMEGRRNDTTGPPPSAVAARNAAAELRSTARGAAGQLGTENLQ